MTTEIKTNGKETCHNIDKLNQYRKKSKKYINSLLKLKDENKRIEKLFEVFKIYVNEFEILSDDLVLNYLTYNLIYRDLFEYLARGVVNICNNLLDVDTFDKLVDYSDSDIIKIKKNKKNKKSFNNNGIASKDINAYFDIKDEFDYYLNELKEIIERKNTKEKKRELALREYFILSFNIYSIFDDIVTKVQKEYAGNDIRNKELILLIEERLESISSQIEAIDNKKFRLFKLIKA